jgi:DNA-binding transcriptional regulator YbjK
MYLGVKISDQDQIAFLNNQENKSETTKEALKLLMQKQAEKSHQEIQNKRELRRKNAGVVYV